MKNDSGRDGAVPSDDGSGDCEMLLMDRIARDGRECSGVQGCLKEGSAERGFKGNGIGEKTFPVRQLNSGPPAK